LYYKVIKVFKTQQKTGSIILTAGGHAFFIFYLYNELLNGQLLSGNDFLSDLLAASGGRF
jgi:hypothetical protein